MRWPYLGVMASTPQSRLANLTDDELDVLDLHYGRQLEFGDDAELEFRYIEVQDELNARKPIVLDAA